MDTILRWLTGLILFLGLISFIFFLACFNHVSINEIGIAYDSRDGSITTQAPGWHRTSPLVRATTLSLLPMKIDLNGPNASSYSRTLNIRLVRFVPEHIEEFIKVQGFEYYGGQSMSYILAGYVFSGRSYPFIEILDGGPASAPRQ